MENSFTTKIKQFGNGLGIRIPLEQADIFNYGEGTIVRVTIELVKNGEVEE